MMISEFEQWLRSRTNKQKRAFHEDTILAYAKAARALDTWMTEHDVDGDFTACDTALLNRFFRDYHDAHTRGGTNTKQRNLRHLFTWLEADYDHPHPYTDELSRYAASAGRPSTLSADFIKDLLVVTGGGHGKSFADIRDHALIRVLTEGLRRTEITEMRMTDLPLDLVSQRLIRVVPLKGARAEEAGRLVLIAPGHCPGDGRVPAGAEVPPAGRITVRLAGAAQQRPARRDGAVPDAAAAGRPGRLRARGAPAHVPAHLRQRLAVQRRLRGRPDAAGWLADPVHGRPLRGRHGRPAGPGRQAAHGRHVLTAAQRGASGFARSQPRVHGPRPTFPPAVSAPAVISGRRWLRLTATCNEAACSPTVDPVSVTADGNQRYDWVRLTYPRGRVDAVYGDGQRDSAGTVVGPPEPGARFRPAQ